MEDVALSFGMTAVVVVDADSKFRSIFEEMYTALKIHSWPLARENHKVLLVERYHRYLNKTQTIAGQDRGTHLSILQNAKKSQYDWNRTPIENTDVPRSISAVGCEFLFPLDIDISGITNLRDEKGTTLYKYLFGVFANLAFANSVVQVLVW